MVHQMTQYGDTLIKYQVDFVVRPKKKAAIHVHPDGTVQVEAPKGATLDEIENAVVKRSRWILKHLAAIATQQKYVLERSYQSGESHFYLGRRYMLKVIQNENGPEQVKLRRGTLEVTTHRKAQEHVKALLDNWYQHHAQKQFKQRLKATAERVPWTKEPPPFTMRPMKKQWGSCSPKGAVSLNPKLVKAPRECIEYVLIHELCHIKEHNHSKQFYKYLDRLMPDWRAVKTKLDAMAEMLLNE